MADQKISALTLATMETSDYLPFVDVSAGVVTRRATVNGIIQFGVNLIIGDGVAALSTGLKGVLELPFAGTITQVSLVADASGSAVVDIWKDTYTNYPPTVADTICASAKPTLSSAVKYQDTTLTGWTKTFSAGDWIAINLDSVTTCKRLVLSLRGVKS